jgi:hypothetical protein
VKLKYKDYIKKDPSKIGVIKLNIAGNRYTVNLKSLRSKLTITGLDISVGKKLDVCLNSYARDDGECTFAVNSPEKHPEQVTLLVP